MGNCVAKAQYVSTQYLYLAWLIHLEYYKSRQNKQMIINELPVVWGNYLGVFEKCYNMKMQFKGLEQIYRVNIMRTVFILCLLLEFALRNLEKKYWWIGI